MSLNNCGTTCTTSPITQVVTDGCRKLNIIRSKPHKIALLPCAYDYSTLTSLSADAFWTTLKATGEMILTPELSEFKFAEPTTKGEVASLCASGEDIIEAIQKVEFGFKQLDAVTDTHNDFVCTYNKGLSGYTAVWGDCATKRLYYNANWTAGNSPGFGGLTGFASLIIENNNTLMVKGSFNYDATDDCLKSVQLSDAAYNAIFG